MGPRGLYTRLLDLRESKELLQVYWSGIYKSIGIIEQISSDCVHIRQVDSMGQEDGLLTIPTSHISHIVEDSLDIQQVKQYLIQNSLKL